MRHFLVALALVGTAWAEDGSSRLAEGAPAYGAARPLMVSAALKRLGADELPEIQKLKQQFGGMDVLNAQLLVPLGVDPASEVWLSAFEAVPGKSVLHHHRIVAPLTSAENFKTFLAGVMLSGQVPIKAVPPESTLGKQGVLATFEEKDIRALVRLDGNLGVVDAVTSEQGPVIPFAEIAKRWPLKPKSPFQVEKGARKLFTPAQAVALYVDGRKLPPLIDVMAKRKGAPACRAEWAKAPTTFDDVAAAIAVDPEGITYELAWGSVAPLHLKLKAVDDGAWDEEVLGRTAPALFTLHAASLAPFRALKRGGPISSFEQLTGSVGRCGPTAWGALIVRSWPNALGALGGGGGKTMEDMAVANMMQVAGNLRTVAVALRDASANKINFGVAATLDPAARTLLETLLGAASGGRSPTQLLLAGGRRAPVYHIDIEGTPAAGAIDALPKGALAFTLADSDETLQWMFRTAVRMPNAPPPAPTGPVPLAALHVDGVALARLAPHLKLGRDAEVLFQKIARWKRLDADLTEEADLLRIRLRVPVKQ